MTEKTFMVGDLRVRIEYDENADSPRGNYDHVARFALDHRRYDLGDSAKTLGFTFSAHDFESWEEVESFLTEEQKPVYIVPVSMYDHGGISLSLGVSRGWDSGQVGFAYVTEAGLKYGWGAKVDSMSAEEKRQIARTCIEAELREYDAYLRGETYGFIIEKQDKCLSCSHEEWQELESCWGFYGLKDAEEEASSAAESILRFRRGQEEQFNDAKERN